MEKQGSLLSLLMNQVKGTRATKVHTTMSTIDIIDFDICTINIDSDHTPEIDQYINSMIQAYNRYLGYSSGLTAGNVENAFKHGLRLYCYMRMLKRYYDAQTVTLPSGEKVEGIYDIMRGVTMDDTGEVSIISRHRIDSTVKGISNKVWVTDFINKVEQVLLPSTVFNFYDYYLSSLFDVSNNNNKEALTLMRFWICDEVSEFITKYDLEDTSMSSITKTVFDSAYNQLEVYLTPTMRNFLTSFLGWKKPNQDWTRDLTGNTLSIIRDEKIISTFNNIYPEKCDVIQGSLTEGENFQFNGNSWVRYYYDFEQLLDSDTAEEATATRYFFGIEGVNFEQAMLESNEQLNTIVIDYYNYLLLSVLCSEEISGSKSNYVGGMISSVTSINCTNGEYIPASTHISELKQFCVGNDISLKMYDFIVNETSHAAEVGFKPQIPMLGGIIGDYGEAGDFSNQIAIFQYPIIIHERWRYAVSGHYIEGDKDYDLEYYDTPYIDVVVNGTWTEEWTAVQPTSSYSYIVDHSTDRVSFNTYVLDPKESHLAMYTTLYYLLTSYKTYNEAITAVDAMFAGKQQSTD